MELERSKTVLRVAELGNISAVAEELNYTASGVSRSVAAMEKELGFRLFYRKHDGVEPTPECERMLGALRSFVFSGEVCLQLSGSIRKLDTGSVTVGCAYSAYYGSICERISEFRALHPGISLRLRHGGSSELMQALQNRELDLCLISRREGDCEWFPLCRDELKAWVPSSSPLAGLPAVPLETFGSEPYIDILFGLGSESDNSRLFESVGISPNTQFCVSDSASGYYMVEAGLGIAMNNALNSDDFKGRVSILPLSPPQLVEVGIASMSDPAPAAGAFLAYLKSKGIGPRKNTTAS